MPPPSALLRAQKARAANRSGAGASNKDTRAGGATSGAAGSPRGAGGASNAAGPSSSRGRAGAGRAGDGSGGTFLRGGDVKPDVQGEKDWADLMRKAYAGKEKIDENWYAKGIKTVEVSECEAGSFLNAYVAC